MWWFPFSFLLFRGEGKREDFETEWQQGLWKERDGGGEEIQIFADEEQNFYDSGQTSISPTQSLSSSFFQMFFS